jgi:PAS domain S-box-containing protein
VSIGGAPSADAEWTGAGPAHLAHFYDDPAALAQAIASFVADGLSAGEVVTTIATAEHTTALHRRLRDDGVDLEAAHASGRLLTLDAEETLAKLLKDGEPDRGLFEEVIGGLMTARATVVPGARLRAYGEMVDLLWKRNQKSAALHLEELWNDLQGRRSFTLMCAYAVGQIYKGPAAIARVGTTHERVVAPPPGAASGAREQLLRDEVEVALRQSLRGLRVKEEELRRSEQQLQMITDALPLCVSYIDRETRYQFVSAAYEQWFGRKKAELLGRRVADVIGDAAYQIVRPYLERALSGETVSYQGEVPFPGERTRSIEATYIPQFAPLGDDRQVTGLVALVSDVSERSAFEGFRAAAAARAERLARITAAVADAVTTEEVFQAVVDNVASALDASSAALWLVDPDGSTVRLARAFGYGEAASRAFDLLALDAHPSIPVLDALRRKEPVWIPSQELLLREYPHLRGSITPGRSYRLSCLPLLSGERTLGALALTIDEAREATGEERAFLLVVARYAGQAIERLRLFEAERKSRAAADAAAKRLALLNRASRAFADTDLDLDARLRGVVSELSAALGSSITVALIEPDGLLHLKATHHPDAEAQEMLLALTPGAPLRMGEGMTGTIAATGNSTLVPRLDPDAVAARAPAPYRAFLARYPHYAMIGAALRVRGRIIGTVTAGRCLPEQSFTADDLRMLEELGERAAVAIDNARLHRETVNGRARAEHLYRFAESVVVADKVEVVFEAALAALEAALGAHRAAILISDGEGVMRFRAWRSLSESYRRAVEGHAPWPRDAVAPQPVLIPDVESDPSMTAFLPLFQEEGIGSLAFIPLMTRGRLIGKFMIYFREPHAFPPSEVELATAIASHVASVTARFTAITTLEETIRYNDLFAGVLGHDLRNPLSAIVTSAQLALMRLEGQNEGIAKPVGRIISSSARMTRMIEQLLDITRVRAGGGIPLEPCETNLGELCTQAIAELEVAYPSWTLKLETAGDLDGVWDPDRLEQVVSNLVSNAGQHGRADGIVTVRLDGRAPDSVTLEVHNHGTLPDAVRPSLFDPFRGARSRRDSSRGLGLGLFIVKAVATAHGGSVDVRSTPAEGTSFQVRLPRRSAGSHGG